MGKVFSVRFRFPVVLEGALIQSRDALADDLYRIVKKSSDKYNIRGFDTFAFTFHLELSGSEGTRIIKGNTPILDPRGRFTVERATQRLARKITFLADASPVNEMYLITMRLWAYVLKADEGT